MEGSVMSRIEHGETGDLGPIGRMQISLDDAILTARCQSIMNQH